MPRFRANNQETISLVVEDVIAEHGFEVAINDLLTTVYNLGAESMADPNNREKEREFKRWVKAVRAVCKSPQTFGQLISDGDAILARSMGICLD